MKILVFLNRLLFAMSAYILTGWGIDGTTKLCISNESPLEGLVHYWEEEVKKRGLNSSDKTCRIGTGEYKSMTNKTVVKILEEVQLSISPLGLTCEGGLGDEGVTLEFNGLDDTESGHHIVDCDDKKIISDLGVIVGDGTRVRHHEEHEDVAAIKELTSENNLLKSAIEKNKVAQIDNVNEIRSLIRENQMLQHRISNLTGVNYIYNNSLRALENEILVVNESKENHKKIARENLRNKERLEIDLVKLKSSMMIPLVLTTMIPLVEPAIQDKMAVPSVLINSYPHVRNRIGQGLYRFNTDEEVTCLGLNYATACVGFDHMTRPDKYPFFNSFVMQLTPLEAYADGILKKEDESCEMGDGKSTKCLESRKFIKGFCPNGITGVYFINDKGKIMHSKCATQDHEVTEDCTFCRKIKKKPTQNKYVTKTSVSLQDAFCQKDSGSYNGPRVPMKGFCSIGSVNYKSCENSASMYEQVPFVTFENYGKMYLDKLTLKNIEMVDNISFICYDNKGQDGVESDTRELKRVKVSECRNVDSNKSKICTGDHIFCQKYKCGDTYPQAKCFAAPGSGPVLVNILGVWMKPMCIGYENVLVKKEIKVSDIDRNPECETCIYSCEVDGLKITSTGFRITSAVSCSHGSCVSSHQEPSTTILIPYPGMSSAMGGEFGIHLSHTDDSLSLHMRANCPPRDVCETHHCFFCLTGIINYQCHNIWSSLTVSVLISAVIYFIFSLLGRFLYFLKLIPKKLRSPFMWLWTLIKWVRRVIRSILIRTSRRINNSIGWDSDNQGDLREVRVGRAIPRYATTVFILALLLPLCLGCSESLVSNSKQTRCTQEGNKVKCKISATVTVKAGVIGAETCFIIKGPIESQQKTIRIKTMSSEIVCREGNSFWTSHYIPSCLSSRRCHLVGECYSNNCQSWRDDDVSKEFKGIKDNMVMSENKCFEQCGAAGCGCFNINPSCLFVHTTFRSARAEAIRVFSCVDWVHKLTLKITGPDGEQEEAVLGSLGTKFLTWGTISLTLDAEGITGSNSFSFLQSSKGGFALHDEAFSEIPREGFLGEIRCSSESAAVAAHSSCLRAPGLVKYKPMTDQIDCTASLVDPFAAFVKGSLPQVRNGLTYTSSKDKKTVQAFNSGSIKALITINMDEHEVEFLSTVRSCEATFVNITGCYSCNYGARVCLKIKSDGNANFIATEEKGNYHISLNVWTGTRDYCQIMHFSEPEVDSITHYTCGGPEKLLHIKGLLISLGLSDLRNQTGGSSVVINPSETSWNIGKWIGGLFSWLGGPWTAILKIIGFLLLGSLILIILVLLSGSLISSYLKKRKVT
ncbi:polyprotein [Morumbi virus]|nr:polyprotein [Morumbi virus]